MLWSTAAAIIRRSIELSCSRWFRLGYIGVGLTLSTQAGVIYTFDATSGNFSGQSFTYISPAFITGDTNIPFSSLQSCSGVGCGYMGFAPNNTSLANNGSAYDVLTFGLNQVAYYFPDGAFDQSGTYTNALPGFPNTGDLTIASCSSILQGATTVGTDTTGTTMKGVFAPNFGLSLSQAAAACGFVGFDWTQIVTNLPNPSPFYTADGLHLTSSSTPFNDPPAGGYQYQTPPNQAYPFYYDPNAPSSYALSLAANEVNNSSLLFLDTPSDPCLSGGDKLLIPACGDANAPPGASLNFATFLVGILPGGSSSQPLFEWTWADNFNGTVGGIATTNTNLPADPGSGTGGITVLSETDLSAPEPPALQLVAVALLVGLTVLRVIEWRGVVPWGVSNDHCSVLRVDDCSCNERIILRGVGWYLGGSQRHSVGEVHKPFSFNSHGRVMGDDNAFDGRPPHLVLQGRTIVCG